MTDTLKTKISLDVDLPIWLARKKMLRPQNLSFYHQNAIIIYMSTHLVWWQIPFRPIYLSPFWRYLSPKRRFDGEKWRFSRHWARPVRTKAGWIRQDCLNRFGCKIVPIVVSASFKDWNSEFLPMKLWVSSYETASFRLRNCLKLRHSLLETSSSWLILIWHLWFSSFHRHSMYCLRSKKRWFLLHFGDR